MFFKPSARQANLTAVFSWYVTKFSQQIYLPSMPAIMVGLGTNSTQVKYTVALYFLGLALSRIIWTPLSDIYGRRAIVLINLPIFLAGTLLSAFAPHIWLFSLGRLLQALGIGCITALGRAMISDVYGDTKDTTKALTYLGIVAVWAPALATILGGHLQSTFGWRADFFFLTLCGALLLIQSIYFLKETNEDLAKKDDVLRQIITRYKALLRDKHYCRYLFCFSFIFGGTAVYYTASPFLFIANMHVPAHIYGYFALFTVMGMLLGRLLGSLLMNRLTINAVINVGILIALGAGGLLFCLGVWHIPKVLTILILIMVYFSSVGMLSPLTKAASMATLPKTAGAAAALFGTIQGLISMVASMISAHLAEKTVLPMASMFIILALLALSSFYIFREDSGE